MAWFLFILLSTPYSILWMGLVLGACFAILYSGRKLFHIEKSEIANRNGSLVSLVFSVWGINIGAWFVSYITLTVITYGIPFFEEINSEWGIAYENAYFQSFVFLAIWAVFYALLMTPSYFCFKRKIINPVKRRRMFAAFIAASVLLGILVYTVWIFAF